MARPDIPSNGLMRESCGAQLLVDWLMALWMTCAFPAEPLLSPAYAIIDGTIYFHRFSVSDDAPSHTPPFALCDCVPHDRVLQSCTAPYWKRHTVLLRTRDPNLSESVWTLCGSPALRWKTRKISTRVRITVPCGRRRGLCWGHMLSCFSPCKIRCASL